MQSILTVTEAAESQDLTVLATVKEELGITDSSQDSALNTKIGFASSVIASECNRVFGQETVSEVFRDICQNRNLNYAFNKNADLILLRRYPVSEIVSVTEDDVLLESDDYELDGDNGQLFRLVDDFRTDWFSFKATIVYVAGYLLLDALPPALERACISLVKHYHYSSRRDPTIKTRDVFEVLRTDYWVGSVGKSSLPPDVVDLIAPYRDLRL